LTENIYGKWNYNFLPKIGFSGKEEILRSLMVIHKIYHRRKHQKAFSMVLQ